MGLINKMKNFYFAQKTTDYFNNKKKSRLIVASWLICLIKISLLYKKKRKLIIQALMDLTKRKSCKQNLDLCKPKTLQNTLFLMMQGDSTRMSST